MNNEYIEYTVREGDSLYKIADKYYINSALWRIIYDENKEIIGDNPDLIFPGQVLKLPNNILMKEIYRKRITIVIGKATENSFMEGDSDAE